MPADWLKKHCSDSTGGQHYRDKHVFGDVPPDLKGFNAFHAGRRERLRTMLTEMLAATPAAPEVEAA